MKKKLFYLLLLVLLATACDSKNNEEPTDPDDPKGYKEKILGDWVQYRFVQYRSYEHPIGVINRDTIINEYSPIYRRFTKDKQYVGVKNGAVVTFENFGNPYQIKYDSLYMALTVNGLMIFAGDSLKVEARKVLNGVDTYSFEVLYRYHP